MVVISGSRLVLFTAALVVTFYLGFKWGRSTYESDKKVKCESAVNIPVPLPDRNVRAMPRQPRQPCKPVAPARSAPALDICPPPVVDHWSLNENNADSAVYQIFNALHHPAPIKNLKTEVFLSPTGEPFSNLSSCAEIYLTRSGSRSNMPNKCVAVVAARDIDVSPVRISHRKGTQAGLTNRYAGDMHADHTDKHEMPLAFMQDRQLLVDKFKKIMGDPVDPVSGERRVAFVMLANSGMIDLIMNFMCSARSANIDLKDVVIFVGDQQSADIIANLGLTYFMHPSAGAMPKKAAGFYGDNTFTYMMWLKVTSVYIAQAAGFDVLFQDADLVWVMDPIPYLKSFKEDAIFMDDGARSPRFAPYFSNSGFYFLRSNKKTTYFQELMLMAYWEIEKSHSHQSALIHHMIEAHSLFGIGVRILDEELFPSGIMFHHSKKYIADLKAHVKIPYVFHMCWTENRKQKVQFFKELGLWFLPVDDTKGERICGSPDEMTKYISAAEGSTNLLDKCCVTGNYWQASV